MKIPAEHIKAVSDLIDYCYDNVPYFGDASRDPNWIDPEDRVDTAAIGKAACDALTYLQSISKEGA